jgi:long-chain acyl-CoA synthetase
MDSIGLWGIAANFPDRAAVIEPDGTVVSYAELAATADRYGRGLHTLGLGTGDTFATLLPNSATALALYFAAIETGLYVVPVNWHQLAPEVGYILTDSEARVFVAAERFAAVAAEAADLAGIKARFAVGSIAGFEPLTALGDDGLTSRPEPRTHGAPMLYTSGTSGRPKGVRRPLTGLDPDVATGAQSTWFFGLFGLAPYDDHVHLCGSPLYHTAVLNFAAISIQLGHTVALMDRWDPEQALALIERHRVTHTHTVPTQFHRMLALPDEVRARYDTSSLRAVIHSAAPCPAEIKRRMIDWLGPVIVEYYAATEGGGTLISSAEWLRKPGSVGLPWLGSQVKVLDPTGHEVAPGRQGLIYMKMGTSDFSYYKDEEKTRAARAGGLFTVGDIGYQDEDGYLFLCDRSSDMIISGGVNIYPQEVENVLALHPKVFDVAVIGVPDPEMGEQVKAVVQLRPGTTPSAELADEIIDYVRDRIAHYKAPRTVDFVDELPRTATGKLVKRTLKARYVEASA